MAAHADRISEMGYDDNIIIVPPKTQNISVFAKVRPLLAKESESHSCLTVPVNTENEYYAKQLLVPLPGKDKTDAVHRFTFDGVFDHNSSQDDSYNRCAKSTVLSVLEGYNATILAYGQTGAGKTYSMGLESVKGMAAERRGIIPRALADIFEHVNAHQNPSPIRIHVTFLEIYQEKVCDLLDSKAKKDITIMEDARGSVVVGKVRQVRVHSCEEAMAALRVGLRSRTTGTTNVNVHASRSHAIFSVVLDQPWAVCGMKPVLASASPDQSVRQSMQQFRIVSKLHLVDLAGSERNKKTGAVGVRFEESIKINSGLLALGNVIAALSGHHHKQQLPSLRRARRGSIAECTPSKSRPPHFQLHVQDGLDDEAMSDTEEGAAGPRRHITRPPLQYSHHEVHHPHVPYRGSRLTRCCIFCMAQCSELLKDSLGGNSKTIMIACLSPAAGSLSETHNTLRYAARARHIRNTVVVKPMVVPPPLPEPELEPEPAALELATSAPSASSSTSTHHLSTPSFAQQLTPSRSRDGGSEHEHVSTVRPSHRDSLNSSPTPAPTDEIVSNEVLPSASTSKSQHNHALFSTKHDDQDQYSTDMMKKDVDAVVAKDKLLARIQAVNQQSFELLEERDRACEEREVMKTRMFSLLTKVKHVASTQLTCPGTRTAYDAMVALLRTAALVEREVKGKDSSNDVSLISKISREDLIAMVDGVAEAWPGVQWDTFPTNVAELRADKASPSRPHTAEIVTQTDPELLLGSDGKCDLDDRARPHTAPMARTRSMDQSTSTADAPFPTATTTGEKALGSGTPPHQITQVKTKAVEQGTQTDWQDGHNDENNPHQQEQHLGMSLVSCPSPSASVPSYALATLPQTEAPPPPPPPPPELVHIQETAPGCIKVSGGPPSSTDATDVKTFDSKDDDDDDANDDEDGTSSICSLSSSSGASTTHDNDQEEERDDSTMDEEEHAPIGLYRRLDSAVYHSLSTLAPGEEHSISFGQAPQAVFAPVEPKTDVGLEHDPEMDVSVSSHSQSGLLNVGEMESDDEDDGDAANSEQEEDKELDPVYFSNSRVESNTTQPPSMFAVGRAVAVDVEAESNTSASASMERAYDDEIVAEETDAETKTESQAQTQAGNHSSIVIPEIRIVPSAASEPALPSLDKHDADADGDHAACNGHNEPAPVDGDKTTTAPAPPQTPVSAPFLTPTVTGIEEFPVISSAIKHIEAADSVLFASPEPSMICSQMTRAMEPPGQPQSTTTKSKNNIRYSLSQKQRTRLNASQRSYKTVLGHQTPHSSTSTKAKTDDVSQHNYSMVSITSHPSPPPTHVTHDDVVLPSPIPCPSACFTAINSEDGSHIQNNDQDRDPTTTTNQTQSQDQQRENGSASHSALSASASGSKPRHGFARIRHSPDSVVCAHPSGLDVDSILALSMHDVSEHVSMGTDERNETTTTAATKDSMMADQTPAESDVTGSTKNRNAGANALTTPQSARGRLEHRMDPARSGPALMIAPTETKALVNEPITTQPSQHNTSASTNTPNTSTVLRIRELEAENARHKQILVSKERHLRAKTVKDNQLINAKDRELIRIKRQLEEKELEQQALEENAERLKQQLDRKAKEAQETRRKLKQLQTTTSSVPGSAPSLRRTTSGNPSDELAAFGLKNTAQDDAGMTDRENGRPPANDSRVEAHAGHQPKSTMPRLAAVIHHRQAYQGLQHQHQHQHRTNSSVRDRAPAVETPPKFVDNDDPKMKASSSSRPQLQRARTRHASDAGPHVPTSPGVATGFGLHLTSTNQHKSRLVRPTSSPALFKSRPSRIPSPSKQHPLRAVMVKPRQIKSKAGKRPIPQPPRALKIALQHAAATQHQYQSDNSENAALQTSPQPFSPAPFAVTATLAGEAFVQTHTHVVPGTDTTIMAFDYDEHSPPSSALNTSGLGVKLTEQHSTNNQSQSQLQNHGIQAAQHSQSQAHQHTIALSPTPLFAAGTLTSDLSRFSNHGTQQRSNPSPSSDPNTTDISLTALATDIALSPPSATTAANGAAGSAARHCQIAQAFEQGISTGTHLAPAVPASTPESKQDTSLQLVEALRSTPDTSTISTTSTQSQSKSAWLREKLRQHASRRETIMRHKATYDAQHQQWMKAMDMNTEENHPNMTM